MAQAKQDMGSGSVKKLMLQLMIPAVVAQVVNLLYNIVDRIYIGQQRGRRKDHRQQLYHAAALFGGADRGVLRRSAHPAAALWRQ